MIRGILFYAILGGLGLATSFQVQAQVRDSVQLAPVTVQGQRYSRYAAGTRSEIIDSTLLSREAGITLSEVLQRRTPLYLKSYGNGMTATIAFRGTSSSHTAVLWNGFNIALPTLGQSDFALLPPSANSKVMLQHGPSGALHGSGAVGGAVILENPAIFAPQQRVRVQQETGSFGHNRTAADGTFATEKVSLTSSFTRTSSENDFRFQNTTKFGQPWERQENAAFNQTSFAQDAHFKLADKQRISLHGWFVNTHRQIQPSMGSANTNAVQDDKNLRLMGEWEGQIARGRTTVRAAYFKDRLDYRDDGTLSLSTVKTYQSQVEHERVLLPNLLLQVGAEGQLFKANVGGYGGKIDERRASAYGWLRYDPLPILQLSLNVRQAWVEGFNPPLTPTLGANLRVMEDVENTLTAKANISRSYRVPTLNDRFWRPGGNPNLSPESGWGYEAGLVHQHKRAGLTGTTELTLYKLRVQDWIQWQPSITGNYSEPVNLRTVNGHGVELDSRWQYKVSPDWNLLGGLAYAYTISEQKLPNARGEQQDYQLFYVPKSKISVWAEARYLNWWLTSDLSFTSSRYTDANNTTSLPSFGLVNLSAGRTFTLHHLQVQLAAHVQNLANTTYQIMAYRAMPPRNYRLSVTLQWHHSPVSTSKF